MTAGWVRDLPEFKRLKKSVEKEMTKLHLLNDSDERPLTTREGVLSDVWAANKKLVDGHWYVKLSDVCKIVTGEPTPNDFFDEGC